jgi:hypothetical protein
MDEEHSSTLPRARLAGARLRIPDSKTEAGIREVQVSPDLVEAIVEHLDRLRRSGVPTGPEDHLVANLRGGRLSRQRAAKILAETAQQTNLKLTKRGLPPLPNVTPHSLRRTYISIALHANNFDVKWIMSQVGHADSKMTLDVYAQLEQRVDRSHGTSFDELIRTAGEQLDTLAPESEGAGFSPRIAHEGQNVRSQAHSTQTPKSEKPPDLQEGKEMARPGLEPGTPRFSGTGHLCRKRQKRPANRLVDVSVQSVGDITLLRRISACGAR